MTVKDENTAILEKIGQLELKLSRIEELLLILVDDEFLSKEERARIAEADKIVKNKQFDKLIQVK